MAKKKGSGQGSIFRTASGKWRGQILIGGKRRSFTAKTKSEVAEKMAAAKVDYMRGTFVSSEDINFKEFAEMWLKTVKEPVVSESTLIGYESIFKQHIFHILGHMSLAEIDRDDIKRLAEYLALKNLSINFAKACLMRVGDLLNYATKEKLISYNCVKTTDVSHILARCKPKRSVSSYDIETARKILNFTRNKRLGIFHLLLQTGMRIGEASALTWDDVDFNNRTLKINKILIYIKRRGLVLERRTKTMAGLRIISITDSLCEFLKELKVISNSNKIFANSNNNYDTHMNIRSRWIRACAEMDIEYKNMHALRHTWATLTISAGANIKVVSQMLGHKDVSTTMNIYQTVLKEHQEEVTSRMDSLFFD